MTKRIAITIKNIHNGLMSEKKIISFLKAYCVLEKCYMLQIVLLNKTVHEVMLKYQRILKLTKEKLAFLKKIENSDF